jgi:hypothetical protein
MLRRLGLIATSVLISASTGILTKALKEYLTGQPMPQTLVYAFAALLALVVLLFDWAFLDKDRPLKASWWYWRFFYLKDLTAELDRQLHLQGQDSSGLPEIVDVIENGLSVPLATQLLPGLRSRR